MSPTTINLADNFASIIVSILTVIGILIAFVAWFIRLESKVTYLEKDHKEHKDSVSERDKTMWTKLDSVQITMNQVLQGVGELKGRIDK